MNLVNPTFPSSNDLTTEQYMFSSCSNCAKYLIASPSSLRGFIFKEHEELERRLIDKIKLHRFRMTFFDDVTSLFGFLKTLGYWKTVQQCRGIRSREIALELFRSRAKMVISRKREHI